MSIRSIRNAVFLTALLCCATALGQSLTFTTLAGPDEVPGIADGTAGVARFNAPFGVATDGAGNVYVADTKNNTIRKISPGGAVTTLAGLAGNAGSADGVGAAARFSGPTGIAVDSSGNVYVADGLNYTIRKITPNAVVTTLAGTAGTLGTADGTGSAASFGSTLSGLAVDSSGNIYLADTDNAVIRKITPSGVVSTFAGTMSSAGTTDGALTAAQFMQPWGIAFDGTGAMYVTDYGAYTIRKIAGGVVSTIAGTPSAFGSTDATGSAARFGGPTGIVVGGGNIYVADQGNQTIRKIDSSNVVSTVAGTVGTTGTADGTGTAAQFHTPQGMAADAGGNLYVADADNHAIRRVTTGGVVTTFAGSAGGGGSIDATANAARFNGPSDVASDSAGSVYVADTGNNIIRKIAPDGTVSTFAGLAGTTGSADGTGSAARFNNPISVATDSAGNVFVADRYANTIRRIAPDGTVTTLAGTPGKIGSADGTGPAALFNSPTGVATDGAGNVYVADTNNETIRKVTPLGVVTTLAGVAEIPGSTDGTGTAARFNSPSAVAVDTSGNVYVADAGNATIRMITQSGVVTTLAGTAGAVGSVDGTGSAARFYQPSGVAIDASSNCYVTDLGDGTIRKVTPAGVVTTVAGTTQVFGTADGTGSNARFFSPFGINVDSAGNVYVADYGSQSVRIGKPALADAATIDAAAAPIGVTRQLDTSPQTATSWQWTVIRRPASSASGLSSSSVRNPTFTPDNPDVYIFRLLATGTTNASISTVTLTAIGPQTLTVSRSGSGSGSVTSNPPGIGCGSTCTALFAYNTVVTLTATAGTGSRFSGWSGAGCSGTGTCTVTMTQSRSATAAFSLLNGDANGDGHVDAADVFYLIQNLFASGPTPVGSGDVNGDGRIDVSDVFYLIDYLFAGGAAPR